MDIQGKQRCVKCFHILGVDGVCPTCHKKEEEYVQPPRCLAHGFLLADRYVTGHCIGEGGFGITYAAWDMRLDLPVAVKEFFPGDMVYRVRHNSAQEGKTGQVLPLDFSQRKEYQQQLDKFQTEAKCLSKFSGCRGIVSVRDYFDENHTAYMVMDYVQGLTLKDYVKNKGRLSGEKTLKMMKPVLVSLRQIHETGLLHRDISPDNILVNTQGELVLVDFGSARQENAALTRSMTVVFKQGFSPEEQYRSRGKQGPWSDIYSLSATMYYMLTGKIPVDAIERMLEDDLPLLTGMTDIDLTTRQKLAVQRGLSVNVAERYQEISLFYQDLYENPIRAEENQNIQKDSSDHPSLDNKTKGKKKIYIVAIILFCMGAGVGIFEIGIGRMQRARTTLPENTPEVTASIAPEPTASPVATAEAKTISIPKLTGKTVVQAKKLAKKRGIKLQIIKKYSDKEKGNIYYQSREYKEQAEEGVKVKVRVSRGKKTIATTQPPATASVPEATKKPSEKKSKTTSPEKGSFAGTIS